MKKTVLMVGCNGEIGRTLYKNLCDKYHWILCDIGENKFCFPNFQQIDVTKKEDVEKIFANNKIDAVVSLAGLQWTPDIPSTDLFEKMEKVYFNSTFYLLDAMRKTGVKKFVFASSNHVTDFFEDNGYSVLGREISIDDYPKSRGIYGTLKLASESLCHNFFVSCGINTVSFRIGTYRSVIDKNKMPDRWNRTILDDDLLVMAFCQAIEKEHAHGLFYLVSDNKNKPWNTESLKDFLKK